VGKGSKVLAAGVLELCSLGPLVLKNACSIDPVSIWHQDAGVCMLGSMQWGVCAGVSTRAAELSFCSGSATHVGWFILTTMISLP
jgi:hypothetical protein